MKREKERIDRRMTDLGQSIDLDQSFVFSNADVHGSIFEFISKRTNQSSHPQMYRLNGYRFRVRVDRQDKLLVHLPMPNWIMNNIERQWQVTNEHNCHRGRGRETIRMCEFIRIVWEDNKSVSSSASATSNMLLYDRLMTHEWTRNKKNIVFLLLLFSFVNVDDP